jgi:hypothetical protein
MRRKLFRYDYFFAPATFLLLLFASATISYADCPKHSPSELGVELKAALNNIDNPTAGQVWTNWRICLEPTFRPWAGQGARI